MTYISLIILTLVFWASLFGRRFFAKQIYKYIFYGTIILFFLLLFYQSYQQFQIWSQNEFSKFLLPPHQSISYLIFYASARFLIPYLISLSAALIFLLVAKILNKKYAERFFYPAEPYFGALAIFTLGHPGWLFYSVFLLIFYFLFSLYLFLLAKKTERISLYYWWLPVAIFVIIISVWLQQLSIWQMLKF